MTPTRLPGPLTDRAVDVLDLVVMEAMLLQALGPDAPCLTVHRRGPVTVVELSPLARCVLREMVNTVDDPDLDAWMLLLAPGLVEEAVAVAGEDWRAEAELGVELACAERSEDAAALAALAATGPLLFDTSADLGALLAARACDATLAAVIC